MSAHERMGPMQQPPNRCKRGLGHLGHFMPHLFVVLELLLLLWEVDELLRGEAPHHFVLDRWLPICVGVIVAAVIAVIIMAFHGAYCDICAYYRRHPRYSPILFTLGRPWWTIRGAVWPGIAVAMLAIVVSFWISWVAPLHYLMMTGYWLGYIAYLRIGAGRVGEGQPRPVEAL